MYRIEINIHEKELCVRLVIYKDYLQRIQYTSNVILWRDRVNFIPYLLS